MKKSLFFSLLVGSLLGCEEEAEPTPDLGPPPDELVLPDISGLDMEAQLLTALSYVSTSGLGASWTAHRGTLDLLQEGCPDLYVGDLPDISVDIDVEEGGMAWVDRCRTPGGLGWSGALTWSSDVRVEGEITDPAGQVQSGTRALGGDGIVDDNDGVLLEFGGEGADSFYISQGDGYRTQVYSSELSATLTGRLLSGGPPFPQGWRQDLYLRYTSGDTDTLEARGEMYFLGETFDRFDSIALDISLQGPVGAAPTDCVLEPMGWIGLRDTSAYWYEVVFLPRPSDSGPEVDYSNPLSGCDGCGTLYVRGVEQGQVCVDFSGIWSQLVFPSLDDYPIVVR